MKSSNEILYEMSGILDIESFSKARVLFLDSSHRLVGEAPTRELVDRLLPTLKARQKSSKKTGKTIYGLTQLIQVLSNLEGDVMVNGFGFISPNVSGKFYYLELNDKPLGATIVE